MTGDRKILLNPGPVTLSPAVKQALAGPDICHREPEFSHLQATIRERLLQVYALPPQTWAAVLLAGSGTAAVEAMLTSLMPRMGRLLVLENGVYGERMSKIAGIHGIPYKALSGAWGATIDPKDVERALRTEADITHVAVVHHETTTGRLNDLASLGALCRSHGVPLFVDAVSSYGVEELDCEAWGIAACAATANKCLHGAPGVSFVLTRRDALFDPELPKRTLYLDLAAYCRAQDNRSTPFTQPVHLFYALEQALQELGQQGGWRARRQHYRELAHAVRKGLIALGVQPLLAEHETSVALSAYYLPEGLRYEEMHEGLKARGFVIYAGQGKLAQDIFRVSTMGAITLEDIEKLLVAFADVLRAMP